MFEGFGKDFWHRRKGRLSLSRLREPRQLLSDLTCHFVRSKSDERHIFVLGPPRSGTTLVRQTIQAHSSVCGPDKETHFFSRFRISEFRIDEIEYNIIHKLYNIAHDKVQFFDSICGELRRQSGASYVVEKTPEHALHLRNLNSWFPNSLFIFVFRDGRDSWLSVDKMPVVKKKYGDSYPYLWRDIMRIRIGVGARPNIIDVPYEEFSGAPLVYLEKIFLFLGQEIEESQLNPLKIGATSYVRELGHSRLVEPISMASVNKWRTLLDERRVELFKKIAGSELRHFGYEV